MWKLHTIINSQEEKDVILDEAISILDRITNEQFLEVLRLFHPAGTVNPLTAASLFVSGLIENNYFDFQRVMKELSNGSPRQ
jgi:hypothetical protein